MLAQRRRGSERTPGGSPDEASHADHHDGGVILAIIFLGTRVSALNDPVVPPSDSSALAASRVAADRKIEKKVDALLARMTTKEKLQQVQLLSDGQITDADAEAGVGGVFSLTDPEKINHFQHLAVEESRLGIPILFAYDTIHGYRTIFPVPLGAASSFDPKVAKTDATIGARESATVGIKQIYSPMVDVSSSPAGAASSRATARTPSSARRWRSRGCRARRATTTPRATRP